MSAEQVNRQPRRRKRLIGILVGIVMIVAGIIFVPQIIHKATFGTEFVGEPSPIKLKPNGFPDDSTINVSVKVSEHFSIVLRDNASVGDGWSITQQPDPSIVTENGNAYASNEPWWLQWGSHAVGGGGKRYYTFDAKQTGSTTLVLRNLSQGHPYTVAVRLTVH